MELRHHGQDGESSAHLSSPKQKKKTLFMFTSIVTQDHLKEELGVPAQTVGSCTQLSHDSHLGLFDLCKYNSVCTCS